MPHAGVGHRDRDIVARARTRRPRRSASVARPVAMRQRAAPVHRVARVDRQVEERILELDGDRRTRASRPPGRRRLDRDRVAQRAVEQVGHAGDQLAGVDRLGLQRLRAREGEQAPGQRRGAVGAFRRIVDVARARVAGSLSQTALGEFQPAENDRQHIVEIMRDAAGQLADRFHLLHLAQLAPPARAVRRVACARPRPASSVGALALRHRPRPRAGAFADARCSVSQPSAIAPSTIRMPNTASTLARSGSIGRRDAIAAAVRCVEQRRARAR